MHSDDNALAVTNVCKGAMYTAVLRLQCMFVARAVREALDAGLSDRAQELEQPVRV